MQTEIFRYNGDLKREVWRFDLSIGYSSPCIYFNSFSFQTKESPRHKKWIRQTHWERLNRRYNNIDNPPIPANVETEVRQRFQEHILTLPIKS